MAKPGLKWDVSAMYLDQVMFYVGNVIVSRANPEDE